MSAVMSVTRPSMRAVRLVRHSMTNLSLNRNVRRYCTAPAPAETKEATAETAPTPADANQMDIRVGLVIKAEKHPEADSLYVEGVDVGEEEPRTIISGLVNFVPVEEMQNRPVVVLCNLKPRNMRGIKSNGMLLCASNDAHDVVEPLAPPEGATPGQRIVVPEDDVPEPKSANQVAKKKIWEGVQPFFKTNDECVATFDGTALAVDGVEGNVACKSLTGASIS